LRSSGFDGMLVKADPESMQWPHRYLWVLAVNPDGQGKDIGTALMPAGLGNAGVQDLPCFLETQGVSNTLLARHAAEVKPSSTSQTDCNHSCGMADATDSRSAGLCPSGFNPSSAPLRS
jgi:GNAT superfamily N-acetyltransferase